MAREVHRAKPETEIKGDWRPLVFVFLRSDPKDNWHAALALLSRLKHGSAIVAINCRRTSSPPWFDDWPYYDQHRNARAVFGLSEFLTGHAGFFWYGFGPRFLLVDQTINPPRPSDSPRAGAPNDQTLRTTP